MLDWRGEDRPQGGGYRPREETTSPEMFHKVTQPVVRERVYAMIIAAGHGMVVDQRIHASVACTTPAKSGSIRSLGIVCTLCVI